MNLVYRGSMVFRGELVIKVRAVKKAKSARKANQAKTDVTDAGVIEVAVIVIYQV